MNWKSISISVLIIIPIVCLIFYPAQFDFRECFKVRRILDSIFISMFLILILYDVFLNIKTRQRSWKEYRKYLSEPLQVFFIIYFVIFRSFFSSGILFVNSIFGEKETVKILGIIIEKTSRRGSGKFPGKYELIVKQDEDVFIFTSNAKAIADYEVGGHFEMEMKKGILNLIYK